ncbi:MAG: helix-turn-helix transcriptional regulator [Roseburia sp.]|nr:helix-turn-helix transcriptional regulator [Roseburia sp.]
MCYFDVLSKGTSPLGVLETDKYNFSSRTINNLKHNKEITVDTLEKLCKALECTPNDVIEFVEE